MSRRSVVVAIAAVVAGAAVAAAVSARTTAPTERYRYTGWVSAAGVTPLHIVVEGDAAGVNFSDRWNLGTAAVRYRVCVRRRGGTRDSCLVGAAPVSTLPSRKPLPVRCCGEFVARWIVNGRVVATWPFLYLPESD